MVGHAHDQRWLHGKVNRMPWRFRSPLMSRYRQKFEGEGRQAANLLILDIEEATKGGAANLAWGEDELRDWAEKRADNFLREKSRFSDIEQAYLWLAHLCERSGIEPAAIDEKRSRTVEGAVGRMCCQKWWRQQVRKHQGRRIEGAAIKLGLVHRRAGLYCSDEILERRLQQKSRNRNMLEAVQAVNELGDSYTLAELSDLSVSNPVIRRGELMVRMSGFEQYADSQEHVGMFYTWTTPSRMHWNSDKFDGTTPRQAQQYLTDQWAKARAAMHREELNIYGFRVAEPHHDGTPHWHMLFFMAPGDQEQVTQILRDYALQVDGDEKGAKKHRFEVVAIDKRKGSAAGYLAKYVAKNIDGFGIDFVDEDIFGRDPKACAARVDAWASAWGIRQFQQVGGPSVTLWRELRRLGDESQAESSIEAARAAADVGDWAKFCTVSAPVGLAKACTGEVNQYGELKAASVVGVEAWGVVVTTRIHEWRIDRGNKDNEKTGAGAGSCGAAGGGGIQLSEGGHYAVLERGLPSDSPVRRPVDSDSGLSGGELRQALGFSGRGAAVAPWSPVNNCTEYEYGQVGRVEKEGCKSPGVGAVDAAKYASDQRGRQVDKRSNQVRGG